VTKLDIAPSRAEEEKIAIVERNACKENAELFALGLEPVLRAKFVLLEPAFQVAEPTLTAPMTSSALRNNAVILAHLAFLHAESTPSVDPPNTVPSVSVPMVSVENRARAANLTNANVTKIVKAIKCVVLIGLVRTPVWIQVLVESMHSVELSTGGNSACVHLDLSEIHWLNVNKVRTSTYSLKFYILYL